MSALWMVEGERGERVCCLVQKEEGVVKDVVDFNRAAWFEAERECRAHRQMCSLSE